MSVEAFRFLHASDFHLELPLQGLTDVPDHLAETLVNAPFFAAEDVFKTAVEEEVDFLILAGDILDPISAGPQAVAFLVNQFQRLHEKQIAVYWLLGKADAPSRWLCDVEWPSNVRIFAPTGVEEVVHMRGTRAVCKLLGRSSDGEFRFRPGDYRDDRTGDFHIAIAYGPCEPEGLAKQGIHYWALGGAGTPRTLFAGKSEAHYCGGPQGFSSQETGPHGCTLVQVNASGEIRTRFVPSDAVRWQNERIRITDGATRGEIQQTLRARVQDLHANTTDRTLLVSWTIVSSGRLGGMLRHGGLDEELLSWLRSEFGYGKQPLWSVSLDLELPETLPQEWFEEDTILGDYLRALREHQDDPGKPLQLDAYWAGCPVPEEVTAALRLADPHTRTRAFREAALLGVDMLRGDGSGREGGVV